LSAGYSILPSLAAQLDAGVRFGDIATAQATFSSVHLGGGATWRAFSASGPRPFELDLRVDFFATELLVSRAGESRSTWLPEAGLALEAAWFPLAPNIGAVLAAGVEAAFGTTQVAVANDTVATMPPFRAVGSFGLRVRF
jgi:hypothetical protein